MSELILSVGQAHKLEQAFRRNGWTATEIDLLSQGDLLAQVRLVVLSRAKIVLTGILKFVREVAVGGTKKFVAAGAFRANSPAGIKFWLGDAFQTHYLGKIEDDVKPAAIAIHRLEKSSRNPEIMAGLGIKKDDPAKKGVIKLAHFYQMLKAQARGQEGPLLVNGYTNIAYIEDENGTVWAVSACWDSFYRGWSVCTNSVEGPYGWNAGRRVLSCK